MAAAFDLAAYDDLFASRTTAAEWARISAFRDLPHFIGGARRHEGVMQPFFAHNLILNKVVAEVWRFQMLVFTLFLHTTRDPADPRSGLTLGNLQAVCSQLKLASPGRVYAFLNLMKLGGYLTSARSQLDSRVVHLVPSASFMATVEEWNGNIFACIDAAAPDGALSVAAAHHPGLGEAMRTRGAQGLLDGWLPMDPFPEVFHFAAADGGWLLMEYIALRSLGDGYDGGYDGDSVGDGFGVPLNLGKMAKRFGGSRSNLLRLLGSAHELGLLAAPLQSGKAIAFTPRMTCAFLTFMASFLGYFQMHTMAALEEVGG